MLVLAGIPGGAGWMVFAAVLGAAFSTAFGVIAWRKLRQEGVSFDAVGCVAGAGLGQVFFWVGVVTLAVGRERLDLDKSVPPGTGRATKAARPS